MVGPKIHQRQGLGANWGGGCLEEWSQGLACGDIPFLASSPYLVLQALTFIIFICFTASISAYMAAALLEFFITLAFLFLYATQYYQRFDRLNWPCLVRNSASLTLSQSLPFPP